MTAPLKFSYMLDFSIDLISSPSTLMQMEGSAG